jgi:hypothetical protein
MEDKALNTEIARITDAAGLNGLEEQTKQTIIARFSQYMERIGEWEEKATALVVTDISQVDLIKQARETRLILKNIRVEADRVRKELKEDSLNYGRAVQGVYNAIEQRLSPIEEHLMKQEKFAEYAERDRMNALRAMRQDELKDFQEYVPLSLDLATLSDEEYGKFRDMVHSQHDAKLARIAEEERQRKEAAEAAEKERQRLAAENAALIEKQKKIMAAQREAARIADEKLAEERRIAAAELAKEREAVRIAKEKLEAAEAVRKQEESARANALKVMQKAQAKAARAPDAAKLQTLANEIDAMVVPSMKSEEMQRIADNTRTLLTKTAVYIRQTLETIEKQ